MNLSATGTSLQDTITINLEAGLPTVEEARRRMLDRLNESRSPQVKLTVIIHGYGSSGVGGEIRQEVRKTLARLRNQGKLKYVIWGENFSMFDEATQKAVEACPPLSRNAHYAKGNEGITVVVL